MMSFEYVEMESVDLGGALLVTGMPAVGMEGTVAATFLAKQLDMRIVGSFQSLDLPPVGAVRSGITTSPIQVWAAELACGPDGRCDRLLVLKSDLPIPPALQMSLANAVMAWASEKQIDLVIGLDTYAAKETENKSVLIATSRAAKGMAKDLQGELLPEAMITGFTAALLVLANRRNVATIGLFAPSVTADAEVEGTTALIETARPLIPKLNVETAQLQKMVEERTLAVHKEREQQAEESRRMQDLVNRGYL